MSRGPLLLCVVVALSLARSGAGAAPEAEAEAGAYSRAAICGRWATSACTYTVKKGDYMWKIAKQLNISLPALVALNPAIRNPARIYPKQKLNVTCSTAATKGASMLDLLCHRQEQALVLQAFDAAGMLPLIADPGLAGTLFLPTDSALRSFVEALGLGFEQLLQDSVLLTELLSYHIVPGARIKAVQLQDGAELATLLGGQNLTVIRPTPGSSLSLGTSADQVVRVIRKDLVAGRAVVHVVKELLLPTETFSTPCIYTVLSGDTLSRIAEKSESTLEQVIASNPLLPDINAILPGMIIRLPC